MTPRHPPCALSSLTYIKAHTQSRYIEVPLLVLPYSVVNVLALALACFRRSGEAAGRRGASLQKDRSGPSLRYLLRCLALAHKNRPDAQAGWLRSDPVRELSGCCSALRHSGSSEPFYYIPLSLAAQALLVEPRRFELLTSAVQRRRSPN